MKKSARADLARETVEIVERGWYVSPAGVRVDIADAVGRCFDDTRYYPAGEMNGVRRRALAVTPRAVGCDIEVVNETTLAGVARLLAEGAPAVAALNFASAKNPGGGFLNGSEAQEESLARSSALHASQLRGRAFYETHRASASMLYSDAAIVSPGCPVFRGDGGGLLENPYLVTFLTCAAPNAGAAADKRAGESAAIPNAIQRRSELVLALAACQGMTHLVLGAWGCGVFRNDPRTVAAAFAGHLRGVWSRHFERVRFSVLDPSADRATYEAFAGALEA